MSVSDSVRGGKKSTTVLLVFICLTVKLNIYLKLDTNTYYVMLAYVELGLTLSDLNFEVEVCGSS